MLIIDQYAYTNQIKSVSPLIKITFCFLGIGLSLLIDASIFHSMIFGINLLLLVLVAKIDFKTYMSLLKIPVVFLLMSILSIVITIGTTKDTSIISIPLLYTHIQVTSQSFLMGKELLMKALASISCTYFMILTTPMIDLIRVLKKLKVPTVIVEIMVLTYRFIFIVLEEANNIYIAQKIRYGYSRIKNSYYSLAILIKMLLVKSIKRYQKMQTSLVLKEFNGEFHI